MAERAEFDVTFQILTSLKAVCCTFWMPPNFDAYNGQIFGGSQRLVKFQILEWCIPQNLLGAKFGSIFQMFKIRKSHFRKLLIKMKSAFWLDYYRQISDFGCFGKVRFQKNICNLHDSRHRLLTRWQPRPLGKSERRRRRGRRRPGIA